MSLRETPANWQSNLGLMGLGLLAALPGNASAQTAPAAAPDTATQVTLPELNVGGTAPNPPIRTDIGNAPRLPTGVQDAPQSISVVPRALIDERGATSLREALRNVTGISLAAGEGGLSGDNLTLRGFSATNDFYIDGIRDSAPYTRDPFNVESIEVLKGPSAVMFGRGSTGGVINQTSRAPQARTFGEFTMSGMDPMGFRATTDINVNVGNVAVRLNAMAMHQDVARRNNVYNERWGVAPSITWGLGGDTQVTFSYLHQTENNIPDFGIPIIGNRVANVNVSNFYGLRNVDREQYVTDVMTARIQHRFTEGVNLSNTTRYGNYYRDVSATAPRIVGTATVNTPLANILVNRQAQLRAGLSTILENQTELRVQARTGPLEHNVVSGLEVGRESVQLRRWTATRPTASLVAPNYDQMPGYQDARSLTADTLTVANRIAVYAVDQIRIGQYFEVLGGVRFENYDASVTNRFVANANLSRDDNMWSWRGALVFKPVRGVRTYFAAGTSYNPSAESLALTTATSNLAPESNISYEFGASWEVNRNFEIRGALFQIDKENARTTDPTNATVTVLQGEQRVQGFEISASGAPIPSVPQWNVIAGYTYLNSEIVKSRNPAEVGRQMLNTPQNTATFWTTYDLPYGFTIGGGASYVDSRYANTANTVRVPSYTRYDATVAWNISQGLTARLNGLNLTDRKFYEGVYQGNITPGAGRTIIASLTARF
ncbi:TonB-dependent receptor [Roseococcus sp. YIM B11640]|uniref:TonB-dependent receptor n=1 Tax=Roseococcus sp. YIM B11640 TaxID=3133973 RepID=UPI003C7B0899